MFPPPLAEKLRSHLEQFLANQPGSADAMLSFLDPLVARYCRRHASTLPADLHEDVVQETLLILVGSGQGSYESAAGTSAGYLYNAVRTALQSVRRRSGFVAGRRCSTVEPAELDELPSEPRVEERQVNSILAHEVLNSLEPSFARLLWRVYAKGETQEVVLANASMSRFTFDRRRKAIAKSFTHLQRCA